MSSTDGTSAAELPNFANLRTAVRWQFFRACGRRAVRSSHGPQAKACALGGNTHEEDFDCAASLFAIVAAGSAYARSALTEQQVEGVQTAIKALGCTVEDSDITAKGDGYKADDVECKDGQYDMTLDKDFKITGKEKED